jgi:hypothetical protein
LDTTNAERQRRYIRRLKARAKAADEVAALKRELAAAKARIVALEKAGAKPQRPRRRKAPARHKSRNGR